MAELNARQRGKLLYAAVLAKIDNSAVVVDVITSPFETGHEVNPVMYLLKKFMMLFQGAFLA